MHPRAPQGRQYTDENYPLYLEVVSKAPEVARAAPLSSTRPCGRPASSTRRPPRQPRLFQFTTTPRTRAFRR
eukprot:3382944-Lingulodinium_polyedra.AAC.1